MKKNIIQDEIIEFLETLVEQTNIISNYKEQIPQIEIDIILSNIREFYEKYRILEKINKNSEEIITQSQEKNIISKKDSIIETTEFFEKDKLIKEIPETKSVEQIDLDKDIVEEPTHIEIKAHKEEVKQMVLPVIEEKVELPIEKTVSDTNITSKNVKNIKSSNIDLFSSPQTIADKFKDEKISLNELLYSESNTDKSIVGKMQKTPISDIKLAIGINEKFKLINELFEGNLQKYNENITKLNNYGSYDEANNLLNILKKDCKWNEENESYKTLKELISRRYM